MSSWGAGSKISKFEQVCDFFIFGSKSSRVLGIILNYMLLVTLQCPFRVRNSSLTTSAKREFDGTGGTGWPGWSVIFLLTFYILCGYIDYVCI